MSERAKDAEEVYQLELSAETVGRIHALALRKFAEIASDGEAEVYEVAKYGAAFDEFVEEAGLDGRIGDQSEEIQEIWEDFMEGQR